MSELNPMGICQRCGAQLHYMDKKCPECGQESLVYSEGCLICTNCGHSRCG